MSHSGRLITWYYWYFLVCDVHPDASKTVDYFRGLCEITGKIRDLQKGRNFYFVNFWPGASTSRSFLSGGREVQLKALERRYEKCFYSPLSICNYGEAGFGLRAEELIEVRLLDHFFYFGIF